MRQQDPQFKLRIPPDLKEQIEAAAATSGRSMNAEIVQRLIESFGDGKYISREEFMSSMAGMIRYGYLDTAAAMADTAKDYIEEVVGKTKSREDLVKAIKDLPAVMASIRDAIERDKSFVQKAAKKMLDGESFSADPSNK